MLAGQGGDGPDFQEGSAHIGDRAAREGGAASALAAFGLGGEGLHHELHGGQQLAGARVAGGEVHRGERAAAASYGKFNEEPTRPKVHPKFR